ncbi:hypothetical protein LZ30DRAFT_196873 [Colletotrichum cereale]|nr:hypothetical protein LZ30DRAFT_196873 [Colletotrichum cereale]
MVLMAPSSGLPGKQPIGVSVQCLKPVPRLTPVRPSSNASQCCCLLPTFLTISPDNRCLAVSWMPVSVHSCPLETPQQSTWLPALSSTRLSSKIRPPKHPSRPPAPCHASPRLSGPCRVLPCARSHVWPPPVCVNAPPDALPIPLVVSVELTPTAALSALCFSLDEHGSCLASLA